MYFKTLIMLFISIFFWQCEKNITTQCEASPTIEPTLSSIQTEIFNGYCVSCHSGAAASGKLDLSSASAYSNLVNVPSSASSLMRVLPGNSDQSYLIKRLIGADGELIMPPATRLPQNLIEAAQQWIDEGAKNN
ncbi:c-type cytochrome domain-containing protein [Caldithrix abyssi]